MLFATPALEPRDEEVIARVLGLRQELRHSLARRRRWVGLVRRVALAEAIRSSNSIEGYRVSVEDALAAVDRGEPVEAEEDSDAWLATVGYQRAMTYVLQLHDDPHFRYSSDLVRSLHFMLVDHDLDAMPGRWRPGPVFVTDTSTGDIVYEGPPFGQVPDRVDRLMADLEHGDGHVLVRAAMAHLNLVMVHPFKDGNGRMARVLQSLVLAREGILAPEFCSIEEYLGRYTRDYYDVLARVGGGAWQPDRDALPWVRFCLTAHFRQAQVLLRRMTVMGRLWEHIDARVERHGLPERAGGGLFLAIQGYRLNNESYRAVADVTASTASRDLRALVDAGLLVADGEKRGRTYTAQRELREMARQLRMDIRGHEQVDPYQDPDLMGDPYAAPTLGLG